MRFLFFARVQSSVQRLSSIVMGVSVVTVLLLLLPLPAFAASYTVSTNTDEADPSPSCMTGSSTDCSLREAVITANANPGSDTIVIPAGTFTHSISGSGEDSAATGDIDITDTSGVLTITGAGSDATIVNTGGYERAFDVRAGASAVISGVEITGGNVVGTGGQGAGVRSVGALLTLNNVLIDNNGFSSTSGPAYSKGTGVYCNAGTLSITDSVIRNNGDTTDEIDGGGVYVATNCGAALENVDIHANAAGERGGGIYIETHDTVEKTLNNVMVTSNAANNGGGIFVISDVTGDTPVDIRNTTIAENLAESQGGGIEFAGAGNMTNTTITQNNARSNAGGVFIYNDTTTEGTIAFSTITNNTANSDSSGGGNGGGVFVEGTSSDFEIRASLVGSNTAISSSGPDCYAGSAVGLTSGGYNYFSTMSGCSMTTVGTDDTTTGPASFVATALPEDNGGEVETLRIWGTSFNVDAVPVNACLDAAGAALTSDARSASRPQGAACDFGAYEKDATNPTVTPNSGDDTVECSAESWTNAGATVTDNISTGLTADSSGSVTASTLGTYVITYTSNTDVDGNTGTATRNVSVVDTTAPTLTRVGDATVTIAERSTYTDEGAMATDACNNGVTAVTSGTVDTNVPGTYTITHTATDTSGNTSTSTRTVNVAETDFGAITKISKLGGGVLKLEYANGEVRRITPFEGSSNFRYALSSNKKRVIVTNGRYLRVYMNGVRKQNATIGSKSRPASQYRIAVKKLYNGYDSVAVVSPTSSTNARLTVFRLNSGHALERKVQKDMKITRTSPVQFLMHQQKKELSISYGSGANKKSTVWKLKQDGSLQKLK